MNFSDIPDSANCKQCGISFKPHTPNEKYHMSCRQQHDRERRKELAVMKKLRNAELQKLRAEQKEAALLVIAGNTARGGPEDWLLDSFAEDVLMEAEA